MRKRLGPISTFLFIVSTFWFVAPQVFAAKTLPSGVPAAVRQLTPVGRLAQTQRLKLAIGLPLRNQDKLDQFLSDINDPASPEYRHYLTPREFTEKFGPSIDDYEAVATWATSQGLTVTTRHPNRVVLDVEGSVGAVEKAMHVTLRTYNHPKENRTFFAPDVEPTVDLGVSIVTIEGLQNYYLPHPKLHPVPNNIMANAAANSGSAPGGSLGGCDFRSAYAPGVTLDGTGQSVGLLQFDGYYSSDISAYETQFGLPNIPLTNVPIDGGVSTPGGGNSEVCLDIEMAAAMAPGLARIYVYEAPNPSPWIDILSRMANDNLARQLSCSWGGGGPNSSAEAIFKQMAAQGQSFFNASGDSDAFSGSITFPSESTNITEVGGTTVTTSGGCGSYTSETVWNWGNGTGSSGGISTTYHIPTWQQGISMGSNQGSTSYRNIPDVALTADKVYVRYNNGSSGSFGGTSCAAPLWAGFTALINQQAAANGQQSVGFINPAIYNIAKGPNYASCFHDVTVGNNFSSSSPSKFSAAAGYDLCTGLGTPTGKNLIDALVPSTLAAVSVTATDSFAGEPGTGQGSGTFTFTRTGPVTNSVTVNFAVSGTATSGADYTPLGTNVTFAPGAATATVTVNVLDDNLSEGDETVIVTLNSGSGYVVGSPSSATVTIQDDEPVVEAALVTAETLGTARNNLNAGKNTTAWQGMKFLVSNQPMTVTALGRWCVSGSSRTHTMKLVNATTQADVPNSAVSLSLAGATPGQFAYAKLPAPITLSSNTSYYLVCQDTNGGDSWCNYNTTVTTTSAAQTQGAVYSFDGVNWGAVGAANAAYGPVDLKYSVGGSVPATFTICGTVTLADGTPVSGVILNLSNGGGTVTNDASGNYCATVTNGWSGTVAPVLGCYSFTPASRTYANVNTNQTAQNFTAVQNTYTISGTIQSNGSGVAGVTVNFNNGISAVSTDANGNYSQVVPCGWTGVVTPSLGCDTMAPISRSYTNVTANQTAQNYAASAVLYSITGTIRDNSSNALSGVAVSLSTGATTNSDANGNYLFTVPCGWNGTATLSLSNYTFSPTSRNYTNMSADQPVQDYVGTLLLVTNHYVLSQSLGTVRTNLGAGTNVWAWQGMKIVVSNQPITVTALGRWCIGGSSNTHTLKLVNAATRADVSNSSVIISLAGASPGRFIYATLPTPVTLSNNTAYYLVNNDTNGADAWYNYNTTITTTQAAQCSSAVYSFNGSLYGVVGSTNATYGPMDFQYVISNSIPALNIHTGVAGEPSANPTTVKLILQPIADYCRVLASSNLADWAEIGQTLVDSDGTASFDMPIDSGVQMQFYRASP